ncbi:hypothetical protein HC251_15185 [Iamia sp. SCSIO 61187]|uniref:hypothetical protein n=1 Tax=Iamia sp. SCSIO 61187 TaxID=2722752 RepID=UPI001C637791|nr:hypothetical protein [Iamia sp. SCSIO 61187]QYG93634.1 hypothetical protein HC251_15185 [Iamia sp. SCSIO 61187]
MLQDPTRVEQFTAEIADMKLPDTSSSRDRTFLRVGVGLMVAGVVIGIVAYTIGHGTTNPLQQRDAIVIALIGLTVALVGAAVFLRYSMAQFLRFWLARLSWEQQAQTDRMVEAVRRD